MLSECQNGDHDLIVISSCDDEVVRWCSYCGSIVVDIEYDGRVTPGGVMKMQSPIFIKEFANANLSEDEEV